MYHLKCIFKLYNWEYFLFMNNVGAKKKIRNEKNIKFGLP